MVNISLAAIRQQQLCDTALHAFSLAPIQILAEEVFLLFFIKNTFWSYQCTIH